MKSPVSSRAARSRFSFALLLVASAVLAADPNDALVRDTAAIKSRLFNELLTEESPADARQAASAAAELRGDGTWADIDYHDQARTGWKTVEHLKRLKTMAMVFASEKSGAASSSALRAAILSAYEHWVAKDYQNPNWWQNQIGVPMTLGQIMLLVEHELSPEQMQRGLAVLKHAKVGMTGQNMLWLAANQFTWASLSGESERMREAIVAITKEIRVTTAEGVQPDWSFHQHGRVLYSGGYGMGFCIDSARWAWLVEGTAFAFPPEKRAIVLHYLIDGQQWMERGGNFDYAAVGREITRKGHHGQGLAKACDYLLRIADLPADERQELTTIAARTRAGGDPTKTPQLSGDRWFWNSDYLAHHRPGYFFSVRMVSQRLDNTDSLINSEGFRDHCLADGCTFLYRRGDEYRDIFGAWDWVRVPGTTEPDDQTLFDQPLRFTGPTAFVGGVSDGSYGAAAMDFQRSDLEGKGIFTGKNRISVHKSWFCFDDQVVCLGAGLANQSARSAITTLNQCTLNGAVTADVEGSVTTIALSDRALTAVRWILHDGIGYVFPAPTAVHLRSGKRSGSWWDINHLYAKDNDTRELFGLWLEHAAKTTDGSYAYVLLPDTDAARVATYVAKPTVTILANTSALQAAWHEGLGQVQAAFWAPGTLAVPGEGRFVVDQRCLLIARHRGRNLRLALADPAHQPLVVHLEVDQEWSGAGCEWDAARKQTRVTVTLPDGERAGSSVMLELTAP